MKMRAWQFEILTLVLAASICSPPPGLAQQIENSVSAQSAETNTIAPSQKLPDGYYVEFRVAQIGAYGHSYVVYGPAGGRAQYADLHPMGGYAVMALGHLLPVPANSEWDPDVLKLPVAARYRRKLSAQQYRELLGAIRLAKANHHYWNAVTNNCNHFIGDVARSIGMRTPGAFQVSYSFVPALRALNESPRGRNPDRAAYRPSRAQVAASAPTSSSSPRRPANIGSTPMPRTTLASRIFRPSQSSPR
jgi:hypothetical protein